MGNLARQSGATFIFWMFIILCVLGVVMMVVRVGPVYVEHHSIVSALASLKDDSKALLDDDTTLNARARIDEALRKRLGAEDVIDIPPDNIKVISDPGYITAQVIYEPQIHLVGNIDLIFHFDDSVQVER